jgi:hypothetical protein
VLILYEKVEGGHVDENSTLGKGEDFNLSMNIVMSHESYASNFSWQGKHGAEPAPTRPGGGAFAPHDAALKQ